MADDLVLRPAERSELNSRPFEGEQEMATAAAFAELCRLPLAETGDGSRQVVLARVATLGRMAIPGAHGLSVTLGDPADPDLLATESTFAQLVDGAQHQAGEGPCLDAFRTSSPQRTVDVTSDARWPRLAELTVSMDVSGVLAEPIVLAGSTVGVLNAYAVGSDEFDARAVEIIGLLAGAVAAVVQTMTDRTAWSRLSEQLQEALTSRAQIDQAKGMLMAQHGCTADEAFEQLKLLSRNTNTKVRDLAAKMVEECGAPAASWGGHETSLRSTRHGAERPG